MDAFRKAALLEDGRIIFYEKALLATGGDPRPLPGAPQHPHITTFRTVRTPQSSIKSAVLVRLTPVL